MIRRAKSSTGFTLVEVAIVLTLFSIMTFPALEMFEQVGRQYRRAIAMSELKNDCVSALSHLVSAGPVVIDSDQRGATLPQGQLRWDEQRLTLTRDGKTRTLLTGVRHASLFARDDTVYLTLEVASSSKALYCYRSVTELGAKP